MKTAALTTLLAATASAHGGSHVRAALEGVTLGQLGPMELSCADAAHGTGAKITTVEVANQATDNRIRIVSGEEHECLNTFWLPLFHRH